MFKKFGLMCIWIASGLFILSALNVPVMGDNIGKGGTFLAMDEIFRTGKGKIIGTIFNTKGEPLENVSIFAESINSEGNSAFTTIGPVLTNSNGAFKMKRVPVGAYTVVAKPAEGSGFLSNDVFNVNVFARKTAVVDMKLSATAPDGTAFIGSTVCKNCHTSKHSAWVNTAHAKTHQSPSAETVVAPFDDVMLSTSDGKVKFTNLIVDDVYKVTLFDLNDETISITYDVVRTHGGVAHSGKQRFHVKLGDSHYILPIQYNNRNVDDSAPDAAWVSYHPERWYEDDGALRVPNTESHSYEQNCEGCHVTGVRVGKSGNQFISSSTEIGIGCEECHGPGAAHVSSGGGNGNSIINPEYMTVKMANQVCSQCHTRVVSMPGDNGANFETGYPAIVDGDEIIPYVFGKDLGVYMSLTTLDGSVAPGYWNDDDSSFGEDASKNIHSKKHHQQSLDFARSNHFLNIGLKCFDCHSPHSGSNVNQLRLENDNNDLCLSCHPDKKEMGVDVATSRELNVHTKHIWDPEGSKASRCSGCHMPKTAKSAVFTDIHSHVFDIIKPATSLAMAEKNDAAGVENGDSNVIMNACFSCHNDEDYGVSRMLAWEAKVVE